MHFLSINLVSGDDVYCAPVPTETTKIWWTSVSYNRCLFKNVMQTFCGMENGLFLAQYFVDVK